MEAEPCRQVKVGFGMMDLMHSPKKAESVEQTMQGVGDEIEQHKSGEKLEDIGYRGAVQKAVGPVSNPDGQGNGADLQGQRRQNRRNTEENQITGPPSHRGTRQCTERE